MELHFSIQGSFITRLARESVFQTEPPRLGYAVDLVTSCLQTDDMSAGDRLKLALDIIEGKVDIVGTYPGDDYGIQAVTDTSKHKNLSAFLDKYISQVTELKTENEKLREQIACITEDMDNWQLCTINRSWVEKWGGDEPIFDSPATAYYMDDTLSIAQAITGTPTGEIPDDPLRDALDRLQSDTEKDYGWLSPTGEFYEEDFGGHQRWAYQYIKQTWPEEFKTIRAELGSITKAGDYLIEKGWVLIHNPSLGTGMVTQSQTRPLTKAQREYLYDYYMERDKPQKARIYMEGDD